MAMNVNERWGRGKRKEKREKKRNRRADLYKFHGSKIRYAFTCVYRDFLADDGSLISLFFGGYLVLYVDTGAETGSRVGLPTCRCGLSS